MMDLSRACDRIEPVPSESAKSPMLRSLPPNERVAACWTFGAFDEAIVFDPKITETARVMLQVSTQRNVQMFGVFDRLFHA
jgi:hypothetical protein